MNYPVTRELDGCYFRVERDGDWVDVCFTDLSKPEQIKVMEGRSDTWLKSLCTYLAKVVRANADEEIKINGGN